MREVVYIVGAGLSKALERPGSTIPLMGDFLATMADHLEKRVVQIAWADFQLRRALRWPVCNEIQRFIDKVVHGKTSTPAEVSEVSRLLKRLPAENIETLLSESPAMRNRISFVINAIFCAVEWNIDWDCLDKFLRKVLQPQDAKHTFVSFNYDLILDRGVQRLSPEMGYVWDPLNGYGFNSRETIELENSVEAIPGPADAGGLESGAGKGVKLDAQRQSNIRILKPHGSVNWVVPFTGNYDAFCDVPPHVVTDSNGTLMYSTEYEPVSWHGLFLIPPAEGKRSSLSFIQRILDIERQVVRDADEIYILGWSMPQTDTDQVRLIGDAVRQRSAPLKNLTVVNRGAQIDYFGRVASTFGIERREVRVFNEGFFDFVQSLQ